MVFNNLPEPYWETTDGTFPSRLLPALTLTRPSFISSQRQTTLLFLDKVLTGVYEDTATKIIGGVTKEVTKMTYELGLCQAKKEKKHVPGRGQKLLNRKLA